LETHLSLKGQLLAEQRKREERIKTGEEKSQSSLPDRKEHDPSEGPVHAAREI